MQNEPDKILTEGANLRMPKVQTRTKTWKIENQKGATNNEV